MTIHAQVDIPSTFGSQWGETLVLGDFISLALRGAITLGGLVVLFLIVFAGFHIITSAGGGDAKGAAQGKEALQWAVIGFILILFAFFIIRIIETIVGVNFLTAPAFDGGCTGPAC